MSNEHLRHGMRGLALRLTAALQASGPLGDSLTKGEMREEEIIDALRPHIPTRYGLTKGVVVTAKGEESDPQDIILVDTFAMPPLFGRGSTKAVPVESVVGVIQVKSEARTGEIKRAVKNLASAKRLLSDQKRYGFPVAGANQAGTWSTSATYFGGALFLAQRDKKDTLLDAYAHEVMDLPPRERCDALCVLDEFSVLWANPSASVPLEFCFRAEQAEVPVDLAVGKDSVLYFYLSLAEHLANWIAPPIDWLGYVRPEAFEYRYWFDETNPRSWA